MLGNDKPLDHQCGPQYLLGLDDPRDSSTVDHAAPKDESQVGRGRGAIHWMLYGKKQNSISFPQLLRVF